MTKILIYDCEVFWDDFLFVFKEFGRPVETSHIYVNSVAPMLEFIQGKLLIGYNNAKYDDWMLKSLIVGNTDLWKVSNDIIVNDDFYGVSRQIEQKAKKGSIDIGIASFDLIQSFVSRTGLKKVAGNMGLSIQESSVSFGIKRKLTKEEMKDVILYCINDVEVTEAFALTKQGSSFLNAKSMLHKKFGIPMTLGHKSVAVLGSKLFGTSNIPDTDQYQYTPPPTVSLDKYKYLLDTFQNVQAESDTKFTASIAGVLCAFGNGGIHGAIPNYIQKDSPMYLIDATSYYPSMMIQYGFFNRSNPDALKLYEKIYQERLQVKKTNPHLSDALKLVLNSISGGMRGVSALKDVRMSNAIMWTGQLLIVSLMELFEQLGAKIIQANTDGILVTCVSPETLNKVIKYFNAKTAINWEVTPYSAIVQWDVNNYVLVDKQGKAKVRGAMTTSYGENSLTNNSYAIVSDCVINKILYNQSYEKTFRSSTELIRYQKIATVSKQNALFAVLNRKGKYIHLSDKNHRLIAVKDGTYTGAFRYDIDKKTYSKLASTPMSFELCNESILGTTTANYDIDYDFFTTLTDARLKSFEGSV